MIFFEPTLTIRCMICFLSMKKTSYSSRDQPRPKDVDPVAQTRSPLVAQPVGRSLTSTATMALETGRPGVFFCSFLCSVVQNMSKNRGVLGDSDFFSKQKTASMRGSTDLRGSYLSSEPALIFGFAGGTTPRSSSAAIMRKGRSATCVFSLAFDYGL